MVYHGEGRKNRRDKNSPQMWLLRHNFPKPQNYRRGPTKAQPRALLGQPPVASVAHARRAIAV